MEKGKVRRTRMCLDIVLDDIRERDCRGVKCTTELQGGVYASTHIKVRLRQMNWRGRISYMIQSIS